MTTVLNVGPSRGWGWSAQMVRAWPSSELEAKVSSTGTTRVFEQVHTVPLALPWHCHRCMN